MPSTNVVRGNIAISGLIGPVLSPVSVAANTAAEQTFTVIGLQVGDIVGVTKPTTQAGLAIGNGRVSAANTLAIEFVNDTGSPIVPTASEVYVINVDRPEQLPLPTTFT